MDSLGDYKICWSNNLNNKKNHGKLKRKDGLYTRKYKNNKKNELRRKIHDPKMNERFPVKKCLDYHLQDICKLTTIHGIQYLSKDFLLIERIWWLVVLVSCILGNAFLIGKLWEKWQRPIIVTFDDESTSLSQIPFPAVTICSQNKIKASILNITDAYYKYSHNAADQETIKAVESLYVICHYECPTCKTAEKFVSNNNIELIKMVSPKLNDVINEPYWLSDDQDYYAAFYNVLTEIGYCYSFNMLSTDQLFRGEGVSFYDKHNRTKTGWDYDNGYDATPEIKYPVRSKSAGGDTGLSVLLVADLADTEHSCESGSDGFRVALHSPAEVPNMDDQFYFVPTKQQVFVSVTPGITIADDNIKPYSPQVRNCYFSTEKYLAHFKVYTETNCDFECLTNYTLQECGCVGLHMPKNSSTSNCGPKLRDCLVSAKENFGEEIASNNILLETCDCLPSCNSIEFNAEIKQTGYEPSKEPKYSNDSRDCEGCSILNIFFRRRQFTAVKRSEIFGLVELLASSGGILGLFCGVSIMSIFEIFYFLSIRLWSNVKKVSNQGDCEDE